MSDNEGSDRGLAFADDESANDVFGAELWAEVKEVCERTVGLLGGDVPAGRGETVRVCLDLPKGLVLTAQYVVGRERLNREWSRMEELLERKGKDGRVARAAVHEFLAGRLEDSLRAELQALAGGTHRFLRGEAERRGWYREKA